MKHTEMKVIGIPGASSIITGASISGLDLRRMSYEGFLPKKKEDKHYLRNLFQKKEQ